MTQNLHRALVALENAGDDLESIAADVATMIRVQSNPADIRQAAEQARAKLDAVVAALDALQARPERYPFHDARGRLIHVSIPTE